MQVYFFQRHDDLAELKALRPNVVHPLLAKGQYCWILQTFLYLRAHGYDVELVNEVPDEGICVFDASDKKCFRHASKALVLVGVRRDLSRVDVADFEIVQSQYFSDDVSRFAIPHWPQPGLIARCAERGTLCEQVSFKGNKKNLIPELQGDEWLQFLHDHGMTMVLDTKREVNGVDVMAWHDYSDVDVQIAIRPEQTPLQRHKPASKLYNSWIAQVPAILGPEFEYRQLRTSPDDYLEASTLREAQDAILRLKSDDELFRRMVAHGNHRAKAFSGKNIAVRWAQVLFELIPQQATEKHFGQHLPPHVRAKYRRVLRSMSLQPRK